MLFAQVIHDTLQAVCPPQWLLPGFNPAGKKEASGIASGRVEGELQAGQPCLLWMPVLTMCRRTFSLACR